MSNKSRNHLTTRLLDISHLGNISPKNPFSNGATVASNGDDIIHSPFFYSLGFFSKTLAPCPPCPPHTAPSHCLYCEVLWWWEDKATVGEKEEGWCPHRSQSVDSISWWGWWRWFMTGKLDITTDQQTLTWHQDHAADKETARHGILSFPPQQTYSVTWDLPHNGGSFYWK